ncbi:MAG: hypothetical protein AB7S77_10970 [Desulfatirhabdiaceae bacterium]
MKYTLVFDLDDTVINVPSKYNLDGILGMAKAVLGEQRADELSLTVMDYTHLVYPGFYEVFRWLRRLDHAICFFSSGIEERNEDLVDKIIKRAFKDNAKAVMSDIKIFSRQHCLDTRRYQNDDQYQPFHLFGNYKKKLRDIVVTEERLPYTLLIEDDMSYMLKGEEENMIVLPSSSVYATERPGYDSEWQSLHKSYFLCGLLNDIFDTAKTCFISLTKASVWVHTNSETVQITPEALHAIRNHLAYYHKGLAILQEFDPSLKFFVELEDANTSYNILKK